MTKLIRWGILATGGIAHRFAADLRLVRDADIVAVGSRSQSTADSFGHTWGVPNRYATYDEVATDPNVDVVYVATTHECHFENILTSLRNGKHVVCEKPLTVNAAQASEVIRVAAEENRFLMEAVWMRFNPAIQQAVNIAASGVIGDVVHVHADNSFRLVDLAHRLYKTETTGGVLLDLGIYPMTFARLFMGMPTAVTGRATFASTGVDDANSYIMEFERGMATLSCGLQADRPIQGLVSGTDGSITVGHPFICPNQIIVRTATTTETIDVPFRGLGYVHEIEAVHECLREGKPECDVMPLSESLRFMQIMDDLRSQWGLTYPCESS